MARCSCVAAAVLFEELIEQHRVHCVVAHGVDLALLIASHQSGVDLFHFLGHETKLWNAIGINFFLVAETDGSEGEDGFARLVHRLDPVLKRSDDAAHPKLTPRVDNNRRA